jgi:hypothetical protein
VAAARAALAGALAAAAERCPELATAARLVVGDPVAELGRIAGRDRMLVLGASRIGRVRRADARRIPVALAARAGGTTAVIPSSAPGGTGGVVGVVSGRARSRAAVGFAVDAAVRRHEPLTFVRLHDPYDLELDAEPVRFEDEVERLRAHRPSLEVQLAPGWLSNPYGLLSRSDGASLLVLEGRRPSAAPPRRSFERWLAGRAREPFVVVADALPPAGDDTGESRTGSDAAFALAV